MTVNRQRGLLLSWTMHWKNWSS